MAAFGVRWDSGRYLRAWLLLAFEADDGDGAVELGFLEGFAVFFEAVPDLEGIVLLDHLMELGEAFFVHLPIVGGDFGAESAADAFESLVLDGDHLEGEDEGEKSRREAASHID